MLTLYSLVPPLLFLGTLGLVAKYRLSKPLVNALLLYCGLCIFIYLAFLLLLQPRHFVEARQLFYLCVLWPINGAGLLVTVGLQTGGPSGGIVSLLVTAIAVGLIFWALLRLGKALATRNAKAT